MPDRAVVDDWPELTAEEERAMFIYTPPGLLRQELEEEDEPTPRPLVAISEDRQWAVLPGPGTTVALGWAILHHRSEPLPMTQRETTQRWVVEDYAEDTGQDAADVLSAWLEGRQG